MICTVSTVKDTAANVTRFVERNLAAGADHMFVFLDAPNAEVEAVLRDAAHVTPVVTDAAYWQGRRPGNLNIRQVVNANLANCLLAALDWPTWLFHIDGDECLHIDKQWLLDAPGTTRSVRLGPLEAVSQAVPSGEAVRFKRLLDLDELALLYTLGLIEDRRNHDYFHGHIRGKSGIRPSLDVKVAVHGVRGRAGKKVEQSKGQHLRVLHYESSSKEEFVRKWLAHAPGTAASARKDMRAVRRSVHAVSANPHLTEERKRHYLTEIYTRWVEDPVDVLDELGYLVDVPAERRAVPTPLDPAARAELAELVGRFVAVPKDAFRPERRAPGMVRAMRRVHDAPDLSPALRSRLGRYLQAFADEG